ncbi:Protein IMPAIRED IN BABA-INDUCED STERILITY 1 [Linum perenne]
MGCISSKQVVSVTPATEQYGETKSGRIMAGSGTEKDQNDTRKKSSRNSSIGGGELTESGRGSSNGDSLSFRLMNLHMFVEREQVSAGWPAWLSDVTGEAIQDRPKLETGRIVALKLDGLITSHSSSSIYLVFEYMTLLGCFHALMSVLVNHRTDDAEKGFWMSHPNFFFFLFGGERTQDGDAAALRLMIGREMREGGSTALRPMETEDSAAALEAQRRHGGRRLR